MKTRNIQGKPHVLVVLKAVEWDAKGRPSKVEVGYDDTVFQLEGGENFFTAFVSETMLKGHSKH